MSEEAQRPLFGAVPPEIATSTVLTRGQLAYYWFLAYTSGFPYAGNCTWWSDEAAAAKLNCSARALRRWKNQFEELGLIKRGEISNGNGKKISVVYLNEITAEISRELAPTMSRFSTGRAEEPDTSGQKGGQACPRERTPVAKPQQYLLNNKLNNKRINTAPKEARGKVSDALTSSGEKTARTRARRERRKEGDRTRHKNRNTYKRIMEKAKEAEVVKNWGGKRFYEFILKMCAIHDVTIRDDVIAGSKSFPSRFSASMNQILKILERLGTSKEELKEALEYVIEKWYEGMREKISKDGTLSVYDVRRKFQTILRLYREGRVEGPVEIPSTTVIDLELD